MKWNKWNKMSNFENIFKEYHQRFVWVCPKAATGGVL